MSTPDYNAWVMQAVEALVSAGYNRTPVLLQHAENLAEKYAATLTPSEAVTKDLGEPE